MVILGCSDYFNLADRRHWATTLARCVADNANTLHPITEGWGGLDATVDTNVGSPTALHKEEPNQRDDIFEELILPPGTGAWALAEGGSDGRSVVRA